MKFQIGAAKTKRILTAKEVAEVRARAKLPLTLELCDTIDGLRDQLERASQYVRMHCEDSRSAERLFEEIVAAGLKKE